MNIKILIQDNRKAREAENMGIDIPGVYELTTFYFREEMLESMWHDETDNELVLGINGCDYRTPFDQKLFDKFKKILG